jgi:hypothetical protein
MTMKLVKLLTCGALLVCANAVAQAPPYRATVNRSYAPAQGVHKVAMVPIDCPKTIDCDKFTAHVIKRLTKHTKLTIDTPARTSRVMANAHIEKFDLETGQILAEALAVDAFAVVNIEQAALETQGQAGGSEFKHVVIQVKLVSKNGTELLGGSAEGRAQGMFTSLDDVLAEAFDTFLDQSAEDR